MRLQFEAILMAFFGFMFVGVMIYASGIVDKSFVFQIALIGGILQTGIEIYESKCQKDQ